MNHILKRVVVTTTAAVSSLMGLACYGQYNEEPVPIYEQEILQGKHCLAAKNLPAAKELFQKAYDRCKGTPGPQRAWCKIWLAQVAILGDDTATGGRLAKEAYDESKGMTNQQLWDVLATYSGWLRRNGREDEARVLSERLLSLDITPPAPKWYQQQHAAEIAMAHHDPAPTKEYLKSQLSAPSIDEKAYEKFAYDLARLYKDSNEAEAAENVFADSFKRHKVMGNLAAQAEDLREIAGYKLLKGKFKDSKSAFEDSIELMKRARGENSPYVGRVLRCEVALALELKDPELENQLILESLKTIPACPVCHSNKDARFIRYGNGAEIAPSERGLIHLAGCIIRAQKWYCAGCKKTY